MDDQENYSDDAHQPNGVDTILIGTHKILSQIHGLQVKESKCVDAGSLEVSEVSKLITPNLPDDTTQQAHHGQVERD